MALRVLSFPDLTVEGAFPLGAAVAASMIVHGQSPLVATICAICAGMIAGLCTALLHTRLGINDLLAGLLTMTALYSINLVIMQGSNVALLNQVTLFEMVQRMLGITNSDLVVLIVSGAVTLIVCALLIVFLHTRLGLALRATGDNEQMIRGLGVNTDAIKWVGLALANGLVALDGGLVAQSQGFADVGMGPGSIVVGLAAIILGEGILRKRGVGWAVSAVVLGTIMYRVIINVSLRVGLGPDNLNLVTAGLVIIVIAVPLLHARTGIGRQRRLRSKGVNYAQHSVANQDILHRNS